MFQLTNAQKNKYKIMSYDQCAKYCTKNHDNSSIIISITTYEGELKRKIRKTSTNNVKDILYLQFCDVNIEDNPEDCMQDSDAQKVAEFVNKYYDNIDTIIIHCEGGISRSAGVCAAIMRVKEGSDTHIFRSPSKHPNITCYLKTLKAFNYEI